MMSLHKFWEEVRLRGDKCIKGTRWLTEGLVVLHDGHDAVHSPHIGGAARYYSYSRGLRVCLLRQNKMTWSAAATNLGRCSVLG